MRILPFALILLFLALPSCGKSKPDPVDESQAATWLTRGGSLTRANTMLEWRDAPDEERLASAADLVTALLRRDGTELPTPDQLEERVRQFETLLTRSNEHGELDDRTVGDVADQFWPTME